MFCGNCGMKIEEGTDRCPGCGLPVQGQDTVKPAEQPVRDVSAAGAAPQPWQMPRQEHVFTGQGLQGPQPAPGYAPQPSVDPAETAGKPLRSRGLAVAALICAVLSALSCFFPPVSLPLALAGLILGILGRRSEERSMATVAVVISIIFLIWDVVVLCIALIYMDKYGFDLNHIRYFVEQYFRNFFN